MGYNATYNPPSKHYTPASEADVAALDGWPGDTYTLHGVNYRFTSLGVWEQVGKVYTYTPPKRPAKPLPRGRKAA